MFAASASVNTNANTSVVTVNGGPSVVASTVNGTSGADETAECNRKHHKHKKRKKHKKHHHRKANGECEAINGANNTFVIKNAGLAPSGSFLTSTPPTYKGKREYAATVGDNHSNNMLMETEDDEVAEEHDVTEVARMPQTQGCAFQAVVGHSKSQTQGACLPAAAAIKVETAPSTAASNAKVKTEHLDLEEESTSNMMSELSDDVINVMLASVFTSFISCF